MTADAIYTGTVENWPHAHATARPWAWQATGEKDNSWALGHVVDEDDQPIAGEVEPGEGTVIDGVAFSGMAENIADAALIVEAVNNYDHPLCPAGCGCHLWTEDSDRNDCACDGPCCWFTWDDFIADVLERPDYYAEVFNASRDRKVPAWTRATLFEGQPAALIQPVAPTTDGSDSDG